MDALIARHGRDLHQRFSSATVAVCGLGGLGSNIAVALARAGIGKLILIDFDRVDITNLHRQQYKANQIGRYKTDVSDFLFSSFRTASKSCHYFFYPHFSKSTHFSSVPRCT